MKLKNNAPLTARIKKLMQSDDDVGKVAKATPVLIAKALDIFLHNLVQGAVDVAESRGARTLTCAHVKAAVQSEPLLDFLKDTVASAPDLPPPGAEEAVSPKPKRQRVAAEDGEGVTPKAGRGRGRGRAPSSGRASGGGRGRGRGRGRKEEDAETAVEPASKACEAGAAQQLAHLSADPAVAAPQPAAVGPATVLEPPEFIAVEADASAQQQQHERLAAAQVQGMELDGEQAQAEGGGEQSVAPQPGASQLEQKAAAAAPEEPASAQAQQQQQQQLAEPGPDNGAGLYIPPPVFSVAPAGMGVGELPEEEDYDAE